MEAAISLWEQEEGFSKEKVSLFYSLHPLDYFDIDFYAFTTLLLHFWPKFARYLKNVHLPDFSIWLSALLWSFSTHNALKWPSQDSQKVYFFFNENAVLDYL